MEEKQKEKLKFLLEEFKIQKTEINIYLNAQIQLMNLTLTAIGVLIAAIEKIGSATPYVTGGAALTFFAIFISQLRYTNLIRDMSNHLIKVIQPQVNNIVSEQNEYSCMTWENYASHFIYKTKENIFTKTINYTAQQMRSFIALTAGTCCSVLFYYNIHRTHSFFFDWDHIDGYLTIFALALAITIFVTIIYTLTSFTHVSSNPTPNHITLPREINEVVGENN